MKPGDLPYPLVGLADAEPGRASWELFWYPEEFATCDRREIGSRNGMLIVDRDARCWRISSVRDLGASGRFWSRLLGFMLGQHDRRLDQALAPIPEMRSRR